MPQNGVCSCVYVCVCVSVCVCIWPTYCAAVATAADVAVVAATAAASALHTWAHSMAMEWCDMPPDWIGLVVTWRWRWRWRWRLLNPRGYNMSGSSQKCIAAWMLRQFVGNWQYPSFPSQSPSNSLTKITHTTQQNKGALKLIASGARFGCWYPIPHRLGVYAFITTNFNYKI